MDMIGHLIDKIVFWVWHLIQELWNALSRDSSCFCTRTLPIPFLSKSPCKDEL